MKRQNKLDEFRFANERAAAVGECEGENYTYTVHIVQTETTVNKYFFLQIE